SSSLLPLRPPGSTLFPYTTLFRSSTSLHRLTSGSARSSPRVGRSPRKSGRGAGSPGPDAAGADGASRHTPKLARQAASRHILRRSEEHTSELQSRENLVCRLLLEK